MRVLAAVRSMLLHPAFWVPILLGAAIDAGVYRSWHALDVIRSDGWGYYLPLPAIFVWGDPHLTFLNRADLPAAISHYHAANGVWQGLRAVGGGFLDKYAFGVAVLQLPFFLFALVVSKILWGSVNGFEWPFHAANAISGLFYFGLGSYLIYRACRQRYERLPSALALAAIMLLTNLLFYGSFESSYAHVYGFAILSAVVYLTVRRIETGIAPSLRDFALFGFLMGLAVAVRPTNAIYAPLFLIFAGCIPLSRFILGGVCGVLAAAVAASPQMLLWYVTTGHPIYYSYTGEGFHFRSPELRNYLISIRKGVLFWHPLYFVMIVCLLLQYPQRRLETAIAALIVFGGLYIGASWGDYTFGDSFGSRQSIELLPILTVPFAGGIAWLASTRWRLGAAAVAILLGAVNTVQFWGYVKNVMPHNDANQASYAKFWMRVLHLGEDAKDRQ